MEVSDEASFRVLNVTLTGLFIVPLIPIGKDGGAKLEDRISVGLQHFVVFACHVEAGGGRGP